MGGGGGQVGPTAQEQQLASIAQQQFSDYQARWLPLQDHMASVVSDMAKPDSWQRQEAEGKGNVDAAEQFSQAMQTRTASQLSHGINVGSASFKMGIAGTAAAEAEAKGSAIMTGNEAIDKAYLANLTGIARAGQGLASSAVGGAAGAGEVASREAITNAQVANAQQANVMGAVGFGLGALSSPKGISAVKGMFSSGGAITGSSSDPIAAYNASVGGGGGGDIDM